MKVLVVGSGGREHALCWRLARSPSVSKVFCAPGNAGIAREFTCVDIPADDIDALASWAEENGIDLTVPGPEAPLMAGIVDRFSARGLRIFGPCMDAAQLEGSKSFAKDIMAAAGVPTGRFEVFDDSLDARRYVSRTGLPVVIKADGLAAGKGVTVCETEAQAAAAIEDAIDRGVFGEAGRRILVEEFLEGEEVTVMAFADGDYAVEMPPSQDHKRVFDCDSGPNTGGMGAYSPVPAVDDALLRRIGDTVIRPVLREMSKRAIEYRGVLYAGLMLTKRGPVVLEFNARLGDPETQVVLPRLKSDLGLIMTAAIEGTLSRQSVEWSSDAAVCVVMASGGYPGKYETGKPISGLEEAARVPGVVVFHAGTARGVRGAVVTSGGRVLGVTATGRDLAAARDSAYEAVSEISFGDAHYRRDIAARALGLRDVRGR